METRQPHVWSGLGSALPCPVAPDLPDTPAPPWTVILWDSRPARLQGVSQIIAACGARVQGNAEVSLGPHQRTIINVFGVESHEVPQPARSSAHGGSGMKAPGTWYLSQASP
jgi:hypothetical protein